MMAGYPGSAFSDMLSLAAVAFALDELYKAAGYTKVDLRCQISHASDSYVSRT